MLMSKSKSKKMKNQKIQKNIALKRVGGFASLVILTGVITASFIISPFARADQFDEKIRQLEAANSENRANVAQLEVQADSYQGEIERLQAEINALQEQIAANTAKRDDLQRQIEVAQAELDKQKVLLGESIKAMYVEGQITTLEMLASSKDLSEFLDKQQYRTTIQEKIKTTLDKINALKAQLKDQKTEVEKLLADQQAMNERLNASRAEQASMLAYTESQKSQFTAAIRANQSNIAELKRQQIIANARFIGGPAGSGPACGGDYPARWCEIPMDSVIDTWGMYNRECVSYTAFKVAQSGRHMPYWGGVGNANQWDDNARRAGIPVDGTPRVGSVAQSDAGYYGHVMYVEHVYGDGTILISQYNAGLDGRYSERRISAAGLNFIHFP